MIYTIPMNDYWMREWGPYLKCTAELFIDHNVSWYSGDRSDMQKYGFFTNGGSVHYRIHTTELINLLRFGFV